MAAVRHPRFSPHDLFADDQANATSSHRVSRRPRPGTELETRPLGPRQGENKRGTRTKLDRIRGVTWEAPCIGPQEVPTFPRWVGQANAVSAGPPIENRSACVVGAGMGEALRLANGGPARREPLGPPYLARIFAGGRSIVPRQMCGSSSEEEEAGGAMVNVPDKKRSRGSSRSMTHN